VNTKNLLLGVFVLLTIIFASLTFNEYNQIGNPSVNVTTDYGTGNSCCTPSAGLFGYWDSACCISLSETTTSSARFHYFSPGPYTLLADDIWNQSTYAYFLVS